MRKKKKKPLEIMWNGKRVMMEFKGLSWIVTPLDDQYLSQDEKLQIIKVVNYD